MYQSYKEASREVLEFQGVTVLKLQASGRSRGFETTQEALIFRTPSGTYGVVLLQQDVGFEAKVPPL